MKSLSNFAKSVGDSIKEFSGRKLTYEKIRMVKANEPASIKPGFMEGNIYGMSEYKISKFGKLFLEKEIGYTYLCKNDEIIAKKEIDRLYNFEGYLVAKYMSEEEGPFKN